MITEFVIRDCDWLVEGVEGSFLFGGSTIDVCDLLFDCEDFIDLFEE